MVFIDFLCLQVISKPAINSSSYEYFLKDHLGSTRMVINDQGSITEAVAYHSYGAMVDIGSYSSALPVREKFTGKEFDQDGKDSARGIPGIAAYHFGERVYDPEVGFWLCPDKAAQFWNKYGYTTSPIMYFDPDGNYVLGSIIGGAIGFVAGGFIGGAINDEDWSWTGAFRGMMMEASFGSGLEDAIAADYFKFTPGTPRNMAQTAYGRALQMNTANNMGMLGIATTADGLYVDSHILYDPHEFSGQAVEMSRRLYKEFGTDVHLYPVETNQDFLDAWSKIGLDPSVDAVSFHFHGTPGVAFTSNGFILSSALSGRSPNTTSLFGIASQLLSNVNAKRIDLHICNSAVSPTARPITSFDNWMSLQRSLENFSTEYFDWWMGW
jgi:RHS repeat-associated core domain